VIITNHTAFHGTLAKLEVVKNLKPGDPNPYVVGKDSVTRYLTVAESAARPIWRQPRHGPKSSWPKTVPPAV